MGSAGLQVRRRPLGSRATSTAGGGGPDGRELLDGQGPVSTRAGSAGQLGVGRGGRTSRGRVRGCASGVPVPQGQRPRRPLLGGSRRGASYRGQASPMSRVPEPTCIPSRQRGPAPEAGPHLGASLGPPPGQRPRPPDGHAESEEIEPQAFSRQR